ncbi:MAG: hypothetical protein AAB017_05845, partial [Nitrospirota bacterium]
VFREIMDRKEIHYSYYKEGVASCRCLKRSPARDLVSIGGDKFAGLSIPRITKDVIGYNIS